ncbi:hypothetical protein [Streptomyces phage phiScoe44]|nr:hypothetical protein [Streptomyces phage phiScoe44]
MTKAECWQRFWDIAVPHVLDLQEQGKIPEPEIVAA